MKKKLLLVSAMMLSVSSLMAQSKAVSEPRLFIKSSQECKHNQKRGKPVHAHLRQQIRRICRKKYT